MDTKLQKSLTHCLIHTQFIFDYTGYKTIFYYFCNWMGGRYIAILYLLQKASGFILFNLYFIVYSIFTH